MTTSDQGPARGRSMRGQIRRHALLMLPWTVVGLAAMAIVPKANWFIVGLIWLAVALPFSLATQFNVRCPRCGTRLLHRYVKGTHSHSFFTQVRCNKCGLPAYKPAEFDESYR